MEDFYDLISVIKTQQFTKQHVPCLVFWNENIYTKKDFSDIQYKNLNSDLLWLGHFASLFMRLVFLQCTYVILVKNICNFENTLLSHIWSFSMIDDSLKLGQADPRCIKFLPTSHFNLVIKLSFICFEYPLKYSYKYWHFAHVIEGKLKRKEKDYGDKIHLLSQEWFLPPSNIYTITTSRS